MKFFTIIVRYEIKSLTTWEWSTPVGFQSTLMFDGKELVFNT